VEKHTSAGSSALGLFNRAFSLKNVFKRCQWLKNQSKLEVLTIVAVLSNSPDLPAVYIF
jgi:hypothetical protein